MQLGLGINVNTKYPEEAWEFIKFFTGPNGWAKHSAEAIGALYFLPARRSLVLRYFARPVPGVPVERADPLMELRAWDSVRVHYLSSKNKNLAVKWPQIETQLGRDWRTVLEGKQNIGTFIEAVTPKVNAILQGR